MHKLRLEAINRAKNAKVFGIVHGTLGRQGYYFEIKRVVIQSCA
jgi:diphthamide biosynthesis enzyme Dph1/Dph2-like protein